MLRMVPTSPSNLNDAHDVLDMLPAATRKYHQGNQKMLLTLICDTAS